jgi:hypothetical protein
VAKNQLEICGTNVFWDAFTGNGVAGFTEQNKELKTQLYRYGTSLVKPRRSTGYFCLSE